MARVWHGTTPLSGDAILRSMCLVVASRATGTPAVYQLTARDTIYRDLLLYLLEDSMHHRGNRPEHGHHHPGRGHHHHDSSHKHGHHDTARHDPGGDGHSLRSADQTLMAGTLADTDHSSAARLRTLTPEPGFSGQIMPPPAPEDCPKKGGSGQCLEDCRSCPNRGP